MDLPKIGRRARVYKNKYHEIYKVKADFGDFAKEYYVSDYGERVGLVIARREEVLLVRQYRLLIHAESWEIPGGRVDGKETPRAAAIREASEEAALICRNLKPLVYLHPGLDTFHNPTYVFYTDQFREAPTGSLHKQEVSGRVWIPLSRCLKMIVNREITDSLSVTSLLALYALRNQTKPRRKVTNKK